MDAYLPLPPSIWLFSLQFFTSGFGSLRGHNQKENMFPISFWSMTVEVRAFGFAVPYCFTATCSVSAGHLAVFFHLQIIHCYIFSSLPTSTCIRSRGLSRLLTFLRPCFYYVGTIRFLQMGFTSATLTALSLPLSRSPFLVPFFYLQACMCIKNNAWIEERLTDDLEKTLTLLFYVSLLGLLSDEWWCLGCSARVQRVRLSRANLAFHILM